MPMFNTLDMQEKKNDEVEEYRKPFFKKHSYILYFCSW